MDNVTHAVLGSSISEAIAGKKAGNKILLWGLIAASVPDLDSLIGGLLYANPIERISFHRGPMHSFLFVLCMAPLLGYLACWIHRSTGIRWRDWTLVMFCGLLSHVLLDSLTTWGTQLFWPFSTYGVDLSVIFVIDPFYTLPMLVCIVWLAFKPKDSSTRRRLCFWGLGISSAYLMLAVVNKNIVNGAFEEALSRKQIETIRYVSRPTPFNIILWTATVETAEGFYVGYYSLLDGDRDIPFHYHPKRHELLAPLRHHKDVARLMEIADGYYTIAPHQNGYIFNDLRFGQTTGFMDSTADFSFAYYILPQEDASKPVRIVRKRSTRDITLELLEKFLNRICGEKGK